MSGVKVLSISSQKAVSRVRKKTSGRRWRSLQKRCIKVALDAAVPSSASRPSGEPTTITTS